MTTQHSVCVSYKMRMEKKLISLRMTTKVLSVRVTKEILKKWLTSDAPTRTYQHLIECLRQSELGALAELIAGTHLHSTYVYVVLIEPIAARRNATTYH